MGFDERRAVCYPISKKAADRGRSRISWVTVLRQPEPASVRRATGYKVSKDRFFHAFKDWNFGWLSFAELICDTDAIYELPLEERDPLPRWSFGRVTLLGDAAHPMRPVGAQAGSQAIVDARVLAFALASEPNPELALAAYEQRRRPIMTAVTLRNREFGPTVVMELAEQRAPNGFDDIEDVIPRHELEAISLAYKVEAGLEPASLNHRASYSVGRPDLAVAR